MELGLAQLAAAVDGVVVAGGEGDGSGQLRRVCTDSRAVTAGDVFVPLVAERDGHDFAAAAAERGAGAMLWSSPKDPPAGVAIVRCQDTAAGLTALGFWCRQQMAVPVVGITGSVGKTSTKDLAVAALATRRVAANERSFNNEIGVPLTLANADPGADVVIVEMGARGIGHIAELCRVAQPTIGVELCVAEAHLSEFGTIDAVATAKGELVEALPASGFAILNLADPRVAAMAERTSADVVGFGPGGAVQAESVTVGDDLCARFDLVTDWGAAPVHLRVAGAHQVVNALAAAAVALVAGVAVDDVAAGLGDGVLSPWRSEIVRTGTGACLINDAYNANPTSMAAALDLLQSTGAERQWAVLGEMAELGDGTAAAHTEIRRRAEATGINVIGYRTEMYGQPVCASPEDVAAAMGPLGPDDAVLVKGSRVAAMETVATALVG